MAEAGDLVRRAGGSAVRRKKGIIERLYTAPPDGSVVLCLDEMGRRAPRASPATSSSGPRPEDRPAERARQEADYGRRGKGYVFGAFRPATGEALTECYARRTTANWVDFLERTGRWVPITVERIYVVLDNLSAHRASDVLLFSLAHPR